MFLFTDWFCWDYVNFSWLTLRRCHCLHGAKEIPMWWWLLAVCIAYAAQRSGSCSISDVTGQHRIRSVDSGFLGQTASVSDVTTMTPHFVVSVLSWLWTTVAKVLSSQFTPFVFLCGGCDFFLPNIVHYCCNFIFVGSICYAGAYSKEILELHNLYPFPCFLSSPFRLPPFLFLSPFPLKF